MFIHYLTKGLKYKKMSKKRGLSKETKELYTSLGRSVFLCFVALFAIATATVAWFASNSRVDSNVAPVSAGFKPIKLAVSERDVRQIAEQEKLNLFEGEKLKDEEGNVITDAEGKFYYYTNTGTIALRLDKNNYEVSPGTSGKVIFYVVPNTSDASITLHIGLAGYGEDINGQVKLINNDKVLNALINGHILLFDDYSDETGYSNWLFDSNNNQESIYHNSITIDFTQNSTDIIPVDFYWIWPTRYQNYVSDFNESTKQEIIYFANKQAINMQSTNNNYRYSCVYLSDKEDLSSDGNRSEAYDLADEYIGGNAQYLFLTIQASVSEPTGGMKK